MFFNDEVADQEMQTVTYKSFLKLAIRLRSETNSPQSKRNDDERRVLVWSSGVLAVYRPDGEAMAAGVGGGPTDGLIPHA